MLLLIDWVSLDGRCPEKEHVRAGPSPYSIQVTEAYKYTGRIQHRDSYSRAIFMGDGRDIWIGIGAVLRWLVSLCCYCSLTLTDDGHGGTPASEQCERVGIEHARDRL